MIIDSDVLLLNKFSYAQIALLIECAEIAYDKHAEKKDTEDIERSHRRFHELGFPNIKRFEDKRTDTQLYVVHNDHIILKSYRGSSSDIDWAQNFKFGKVEPKDTAMTRLKDGIEVHQGHHEQVCGLYDQQMSYITGIMYYRNKKMYGTGHSLGASDITIDFVLTDKKTPYDGLVAAGSSRSGNKRFAKHVKKMNHGRLVRITNNSDIVTRVPLILQGFRHSGVDHYIDSFGNIHVGGLNPLFGGLDWAKGALTGMFIKGKGLTDDHHPCYYYNTYAKKAGGDRRLDLWPNYR